MYYRLKDYLKISNKKVTLFQTRKLFCVSGLLAFPEFSSKFLVKSILFKRVCFLIKTKKVMAMSHAKQTRAK